MIEFTSFQLNSWLATFLWPLARILAVIAVSPFFSNQSIPGMIKIGLGVGLTLMSIPALPPMPNIPVSSITGLLILTEQVVIGTAIGFTFRLIVAAIEMAGETMSQSSGLGFAAFFDPHSEGQTGVIRQLLVVITTTAFVSFDGHLMIIETLVNSFSTFPVSATPLNTHMPWQVVVWGGQVFSSGLHLALPVIAAMLIANMALGILTKAAPQLNLFAVGFPFTLGIAFMTLIFVIPLMETPVGNLFNEGFSTVRKILAPVK